MTSAPPIHLPTEIVVQIVAYVAANESAQASLFTCCLVSRQWYSCAITSLYENPRIDTGASFKGFTNTICPPIGARKSKWNLGALVRRLDLSTLVHHSSPSLTARLMGRVKDNLEVLIAPRASFASNSLPALSKCSKLQLLDLSLVATPVPFEDLKKSLSNLQGLHTLRLPQSTSITGSDSFSIPWSPKIRRLQFSGHFSAAPMRSFPWPPSLTNLTLKNCDDLSLANLSSLMCSPSLSRTLKRLTISGQNRRLSSESISSILALIPELSFLSIPGDMVDGTFFELLCHIGIPTLKVLEFGYPAVDPAVYFTTEGLLKALEYGLPNLSAVGFAEVFCSDDETLDDDAVDNFLLDRMEKSNSLQPSIGNVQSGVYYV
ncbi:F-box domain protein [Aspergillus lucknowensis]|uniref:F-box domain-containing protein n=1 Tax=Aspergillus lucknowensis TaxID=176173 RepID=A0ABR4LZC9_9EURO